VGDVLVYLVGLAEQCGVDLGPAAAVERGCAPICPRGVVLRPAEDPSQDTRP